MKKEAESRILEYINNWKSNGYSSDIPDSAPSRLDELGLVPSYKKIALAILNNDFPAFNFLGFKNKSNIYSIIKRDELIRNGKHKPQLKLHL